MRNTASLILAVRKIARNVANPDGTYAVSDDEVLQYLNDAQDRMQNLMSAQKNIAKIFVTEKIISVVQNQAEYSIPDRVLMNKQIEYVEFSATGLVGDYIRLEKLNYFNRDTNTTTYPHGYFKRGNQILLQPTPSTTQGSIRISYERDIYDLDITRGRVNGTPSGALIDLTNSTFGAPTTANEALFTSGTKINIWSVSNTLLLQNGVISNYVGATDELTLAANVSTYLTTGSALADLADGILVLYPYTTLISELPDTCERYLIHYAAAEMLRRDSSNDYGKAKELVGLLEKDIIDAFKSQTGEIQFTPQLSRYEWW